MIRRAFASACALVAMVGVAHAQVTEPAEPTTPPSEQQPPPQTPPAEPQQVPVYPPPAAVPPPPPMYVGPQPVTQVQPVVPPPTMELSAGGGVEDFADRGTSRLTKIGGEWDVRLLFGANFPVAGEIAYVGTANGVNNVMAPYASGGTILGTSLEGDLRLQMPLMARVRPFAFGGVGWNSFELVNDDFRVPNAINRFDDTLLIPFGGGIEANVYQGLTLDTRFTYRAMFEEDLIHVDELGRAGAPSQGMSQWAISARLGYLF